MPTTTRNNTTDNTTRANTPMQPESTPTSTDRGRSTAADKLWTALQTHPNSTTAELASLAGIGRSTAAKILSRWAADAIITRTTDTTTTDTTTAAATKTAGRTPDRWAITARQNNPAETGTPQPAVDDAQSPDTPSAPPTADTSDTDADTTTKADADAGDNADAGDIDAHADVADQDGEAAAPADAAAPAEEDQTAIEAAAPAPPELAGQTPTTDNADDSSGGGEGGQSARRLPAGGLRGLVEDFLRERPTGEFGPSQIGKELKRSSGAVANALDKLVAAGSVVKTNDSPRRYSLAPAEQEAPLTQPDATTT